MSLCSDTYSIMQIFTIFTVLHHDLMFFSCPCWHLFINIRLINVAFLLFTSPLPFQLYQTSSERQDEFLLYTIISFLLEVNDIQKLQTRNNLTKKIVVIMTVKPKKKKNKTKKKHSENIPKITSLTLFNHATLPLLSKICLTSILLTLS